MAITQEHGNVSGGRMVRWCLNMNGQLRLSSSSVPRSSRFIVLLHQRLGCSSFALDR